MDTQAALEMAKEEIRKGNKKEARAILRNASKNDPQNEAIYLLFAQVAGNKEHAIQALNYVLKINPANAQAKKWLNQLQPPLADPGERIPTRQPAVEEGHELTGYIASNLMPDEKVIYKAKLHWGIFINPAIFMLLFILLFVCPYSLIATGGISDQDISMGVCNWMLAFAIMIPLGFLIRAAAIYVSTEFVLTNKRILHKVGLIRRRSFELVLTHMEGVAIDQSAIGRMLGFGTVQTSGSGGSGQNFKNIKDPQEFRNQVYSQIKDR